jgi:hypothetical protein
MLENKFMYGIMHSVLGGSNSSWDHTVKPRRGFAVAPVNMPCAGKLLTFCYELFLSETTLRP